MVWGISFNTWNIIYIFKNLCWWKKVDKAPNKDEGYSFSNVVCDNAAVASWNEENWNLLVTKITKRTKCTLYFTSAWSNIKFVSMYRKKLENV